MLERHPWGRATAVVLVLVLLAAPLVACGAGATTGAIVGAAVGAAIGSGYDSTTCDGYYGCDPYYYAPYKAASGPVEYADTW
jgi:hypothetical protein